MLAISTTMLSAPRSKRADHRLDVRPRVPHPALRERGEVDIVREDVLGRLDLRRAGRGSTARRRRRAAAGTSRLTQLGLGQERIGEGRGLEIDEGVPERRRAEAARGVLSHGLPLRAPTAGRRSRALRCAGRSWHADARASSCERRDRRSPFARDPRRGPRSSLQPHPGRRSAASRSGLSRTPRFRRGRARVRMCRYVLWAVTSTPRTSKPNRESVAAQTVPSSPIEDGDAPSYRRGQAATEARCSAITSSRIRFRSCSGLQPIVACTFSVAGIRWSMSSMPWP